MDDLPGYGAIRETDHRFGTRGQLGAVGEAEDVGLALLVGVQIVASGWAARLSSTSASP
jgi:hypothetical protein